MGVYDCLMCMFVRLLDVSMCMDVYVYMCMRVYMFVCMNMYMYIQI